MKHSASFQPCVKALPIYLRGLNWRIKFQTGCNCVVTGTINFTPSFHVLTLHDLFMGNFLRNAHPLEKREKLANTPIHWLTCDVTSCLFADIFAMEALEQKKKKKMGEEKEEDRSKKRRGERKGECLFLMDEVFSCYFWREHSCEELLSTRKQAVCFRQACRAPGPTSHLYSSDTWSQPDNTCGSWARSTKKWEIFSTRTKKQSTLNTTGTPLGINSSCFSLCCAGLCATGEREDWKERKRFRD